MVEDIKILLDAVSNMDNGALYVVILIVLYKFLTKLALISAVFCISRLLITKVYMAITYEDNTRPHIHIHKLGKYVLHQEKDFIDIYEILMRIRKANPKTNLSNSSYLSREDFRKIDEAISQYIEKSETTN